MGTKYDHVFPENEGVSVIIKDGKYGAILSGGNILIQPKYDYLSSFKGGIAETLNGRIDLSEHPVILLDEEFIHLPGYDSARDYKDLYSIVIKEGKCGIIDINQKEVIPCEYDYISDFTNGIAYTYNIEGRQGRNGFISCRLNHLSIIKPQYDEISHFVDDLAVIRQQWGKGVINRLGEIIIEPEYKAVTIYNNVIYAIKDYKVYCFSNKGEKLEKSKTNPYIPGSNTPQIFPIDYCHYGLKDKKGSIISDYHYTQIGNFINGKAKVCFNHCPSSIINEDGRIILSKEDIEVVLPDKYYYGFFVGADSAILFEKGTNRRILFSKDGKELAELPVWNNSILFDDRTFLLSQRNGTNGNSSTIKIAPDNSIEMFSGSINEMGSNTFYLSNSVRDWIETPVYVPEIGEVEYVKTYFDYLIELYSVIKTDGTIIIDNVPYLQRIEIDSNLFIFSKSGKTFGIINDTGEILIENQIEWRPTINGYNVKDADGVITFIEEHHNRTIDLSSYISDLETAETRLEDVIEDSNKDIKPKSPQNAKSHQWLNNLIEGSDGLYYLYEDCPYDNKIVDKDGNLLFSFTSYGLYGNYGRQIIFQSGFATARDSDSGDFCILSDKGLVYYRSETKIDRILGEPLFYLKKYNDNSWEYTIINARGSVVRVVKWPYRYSFDGESTMYEILSNGYFLFANKLFDYNGIIAGVTSKLHIDHKIIKSGDILIGQSEYDHDYIFDLYGNRLVKGKIGERNEKYIVFYPQICYNTTKREYSGSTCGIIDTCGFWIVDPLYTSISLKDGIFEATLKEDTAFIVKISLNGSFIVNQEDESVNIRTSKYKGITDFDGEYAIVCGYDNGLFGLINRELEEVFPPTFSHIEAIGNGFYKVYKNGECGIINNNASVIIQLLYSTITKSKYGWVLKKELKGCYEKIETSLYGMMNDNFEIIIPCIYSALGNITNNRIQRINKFEYSTHFDYNYDQRRIITAEKFPACKDGKWGVIDCQGNTILPFRYQYLHNVDNEKFIVFEESTLLGVISLETQKVIIPARFKKISISSDNITTEIKKNSYIFNHSGVLIRWSIEYPRKIVSFDDIDYSDGDADDWGQDSEMDYMIEAGADFD